MEMERTKRLKLRTTKQCSATSGRAEVAKHSLSLLRFYKVRAKGVPFQPLEKPVRRGRKKRKQNGGFEEDVYASEWMMRCNSQRCRNKILVLVMNLGMTRL